VNVLARARDGPARTARAPTISTSVHRCPRVETTLLLVCRTPPGVPRNRLMQQSATKLPRHSPPPAGILGLILSETEEPLFHGR
jgi:hypothetical protein